MSNQSDNTPVASVPATGFEAWWATKIPVWLQWLLCLPTALLASGVIVFIFRAANEREWFLPVIGTPLRLFEPTVAFGVFLWVFWMTVPRAKMPLVIAFASLRLVLSLTLFVVTACVLSDVGDMGRLGPVDAEWWVAIVADAILAAILGFAGFAYARGGLSDLEA